MRPWECVPANRRGEGRVVGRGCAGRREGQRERESRDEGKGVAGSTGLAPARKIRKIREIRRGRANFRDFSRRRREFTSAMTNFLNLSLPVARVWLLKRTTKVGSKRRADASLV